MKKMVTITKWMGFGGCEKVIANINNEFAKDGIECTIITFINEDCVYDLDPNIKHIKLNKNNVEISKFNKIKLAYEIRKKIKKIRPDRILIMPEEMNSIMIPFLMDLKIPIIISDRNNPWIMPKHKINKILRFLFYKYASGYVFQTKEAKSFYSKNIQKRSTVILNPLDVNRLAKEEPKKRVKTIVTAGRLDNQKNHKLLIRTFARFNEIKQDYKLIIYGDGELKEEIIELANELIPKGNFELRSATNNVLIEINDASIFVLSSDYEGLPNILIEAMACGLPCISTNCPSGGPAELIKSGENGILVPVNEEEILLEAMIKLSEDRDYAEKLGSNATKVIEKTNPKKIIKEWKEYIEKDFR